MDRTRELPFFVYGTLRQGESNATYLDKVAVRARPGRLCGVQMFDLGPYPMLVEIEVESAALWVEGELVEIEPSRYGATLAVLDQLEGVDPRQPNSPRGLYRRVMRQVQLEMGEVALAWVYLGREDLARRGRLVENGDWKRRFEKSSGGISG